MPLALMKMLVLGFIMRAVSLGSASGAVDAKYKHI
jgi:hypothetical protein